MEFRILGSLEVSRDGIDLAFGGRKQRALLALLLTQPNKVISPERLAELLWSDDAPETARHAIEVYVSQLRRVIEPEGPPYRILVRSNAGYSIRVKVGELDSLEFERMTASAIGRSAEETAADLNRALALWRGPALADFAAEEFAMGEVARLNELRLNATEELIDAELALGRHDAVIGELVSLTRQHPLRERLAGQLMLALYQAGRQAEASDVYQRTRDRLVDEVGMEPGPELQNLLRRILKQDPALTPAAFNLPSGTVTFVMTDIVGSTRLWDGSASSAGAAIGRHNAIVVEQVQRHRGQVVEAGREGDSFLAVFRQASDAVLGAISLQRALATEAWPEGAAITVRVGVHTGEAEPHANHYVGGALYRCARLMSVGHGGQVLLSQATHDLVVDRLPADVTVLDLGLHHLPDLSRPEHVFQTLHPDLPTRFPPLRTVDSRGNLPQEAASFIGREELIREVADRLQTSRLVTLAGPGGAGKTRLAVRVGHLLAGEFSGGTWLIELAGVSDGVLLVPEVAHTLGIDNRVGEATLASLGQSLAERESLLVLDNCEHLIDAVAQFVHGLLRATRRVRVIATSREPLRLDGESVVRVGPLTTSEAVDLFEARTEVRGLNVEELTSLCSRLGGMPLAIELAAARASTLSLSEMTDRLDSQIRLLTSGGRSAPARHKSLEATLDWSYGLLGATEAALFRCLALFGSGFGLDAVEAIGASPDLEVREVANVFGRLIDKSLVMVDRQDRGTRYSLHEAVREYSGAKLHASPERTEVKDRFLSYYEGLLEHPPGDEITWLPWMSSETDNMRRAVEIATASSPERAASLVYRLCSWWTGVGALTEGLQLVEPVVRNSPRNSRAEALACIAMARLMRVKGPPEVALPWAARAVASATAVGEANLLAAAHLQRGELAGQLGDGATARSAFEQAIAAARTSGDLPLLCSAMNSAARFELRVGKVDAAEGLLAEAVRIAPSLAVHASVLQSQARLLIDRGQIDAARRVLAQSLDLSRKMGRVMLISSGLDVAAVLALAESDHERALVLASAADAVRRRVGMTRGVWTSWIDETQTEARRGLDLDAIDEAWAQGQTMRLEDVVEFAAEPTLDSNRTGPQKALE